MLQPAPLRLLRPAELPTRSAPRPSFVTAAGRFDLEAIMRLAHAEVRANVARAAALKTAMADAWETARAQKFCRRCHAELAAVPAAHAAILAERTAVLMGIDSGRRMLAEVAMLEARAAAMGLRL